MTLGRGSMTSFGPFATDAGQGIGLALGADQRTSHASKPGKAAMSPLVGATAHSAKSRSVSRRRKKGGHDLRSALR